MGRILTVLSNAGMVPLVKHNGLAERVTGFASSTLDRVSVTSQDSMSFELACSESNSALVTLCLTFSARTSFTKSFFPLDISTQDVVKWPRFDGTAISSA